MRLIGLLALLLLAPAAVQAEPQTIKDAPADKQDAAVAHFRLGVAFYRAGDYAAARVEFEAAHRLSDAPDLLHNLSLTAERLGRYGEAIDYEQRWLQAAGSSLTAEEADQARGRLLRLRDLQQPPSGPIATSAPRAPRSGHVGWRPPFGAISTSGSSCRFRSCTCANR